MSTTITDKTIEQIEFVYHSKYITKLEQLIKLQSEYDNLKQKYDQVKKQHAHMSDTLVFLREYLESEGSNKTSNI
jgi:hypothetical protein